jgi:hypothetical protein
MVNFIWVLFSQKVMIAMLGLVAYAYNPSYSVILVT